MPVFKGSNKDSKAELEPGEINDDSAVKENSTGQIIDKETDEILLDAPKTTRFGDVSVFSSDELADVKSFAHAAELARQTGVAEAADVLGDGYQLLENKDEIANVAQIWLDWRFSTSNKFRTKDGEPGTFVIVKLMTEDDRKLMFTDGSTGICKSLLDYTKRGGRPPLVLTGLRKSTYPTEDGNGNPIEATTYWPI